MAFAAPAAVIACRPGSARVGPPRPRKPPPPPPSTPKTPRACAKTPAALPTLYRARAETELDVSVGAHVLRAGGGKLDHVHASADAVALVDAVGAAGARVLGRLRVALAAAPVYPDEATRGLRGSLAAALSDAPGASALVARASDGVLRVAWAGPVGLLVVRGDRVAFRTYTRGPARTRLESALPGRPKETEEEVTTEVADAKEAVNAEFFALECGDLIVAGSDGLFANLGEEQILAFVRPVPDPNDKTLAIANNTCLGSWQTDDVDFISYYLAHLAENFATARHSPPFLPFPFPPGPRVDDISVLAASCAFPER